MELSSHARIAYSGKEVEERDKKSSLVRTSFDLKKGKGRLHMYGTQVSLCVHTCSAAGY